MFFVVLLRYDFTLFVIQFNCTLPEGVVLLDLVGWFFSIFFLFLQPEGELDQLAKALGLSSCSIR